MEIIYSVQVKWQVKIMSFKGTGQIKLKVLRDLSATPVEHLAADLSKVREIVAIFITVVHVFSFLHRCVNN